MGNFLLALDQTTSPLVVHTLVPTENIPSQDYSYLHNQTT